MSKSRNRKKKKQNKVQQHKPQIPQKRVEGPQGGTIQKQTVIHTSYIGPIPPAEDLDRYNQITPGAADRIIAMAEKEQTHRHNIDGDTTRGFTEYMRRGQWFAFILGAVSFLGGIFLIYTGSAGIGASIFMLSLATLVGAAIWGFKSPKIIDEDDINNEPEENSQ